MSLRLALAVVLLCTLGFACGCPTPIPTPTPCPICEVCPTPTPTPMPVPCEIPPLGPQTPPCGFWGTVTLNGQPVPDGTLIEAVIKGCIYQFSTPSAHGPSTYRAIIYQPIGVDYEYEHITFVVSGVTMSHEAVYLRYDNFRFDLSVP